MHTSRCLSHVGAIATIVLPSKGRALAAAREALDFSDAGPFSVCIDVRAAERTGIVLVGDVKVYARVFYGGTGGDDDEEDVRVVLDLDRGPARLLVPADALVRVHSESEGFEVWPDELEGLDCGKGRA